MRTLRNTVMYKSMKLIDNHFYTFQMVMCIFATFQLELYSMYSLLFFVPLYININVSIKGVLVILHLLLFYFCAHPLFSNLFSTGGKEVNTRATLGITSADWFLSFLWGSKTRFAWLAKWCCVTVPKLAVHFVFPFYVIKLHSEDFQVTHS